MIASQILWVFSNRYLYALCLCLKCSKLLQMASYFPNFSRGKGGGMPPDPLEYILICNSRTPQPIFLKSLEGRLRKSSDMIAAICEKLLKKINDNRQAALSNCLV